MSGTEELWGKLPTGLLSIACSACFPIPPRIYCPGVAQWAQSFNINHYQENILYRLAFRQFDGDIFTNDLSPFPRKFLSYVMLTKTVTQQNVSNGERTRILKAFGYTVSAWGWRHHIFILYIRKRIWSRVLVSRLAKWLSWIKRGKVNCLVAGKPCVL